MNEHKMLLRAGCRCVQNGALYESLFRSPCSRRIRDGASEGSGPSGVLGDPPNVEGRPRVCKSERGTASDRGGDGGEFPLHVGFATATMGREQVSPGVPGLPGRRKQAVPSQEQGPYDGQARRDRRVGLPHTPPQVNAVRAPQGALEGDACSAALWDSLDAFFSQLHEWFSFLETDLGASRRFWRRRRRLSSSSSDGAYSGGDGALHVPRRAVSRALGRDVEGNPRRRPPEKIIPADDRTAEMLDFLSHALANTDVLYDRTMAHGLGRLRKDVSATFGRDAERDGPPELGILEFPNRFVKRGMTMMSQWADPSTSSRSSPILTSNGICTPSCRPCKEDVVERSISIRNWSLGFSEIMRMSSR